MQRLRLTNDGEVSLVDLLQASPILDLLGDAKSILRLSSVCKRARAQLQSTQRRIKTAGVKSMHHTRMWLPMLRSITSLEIVSHVNVNVLAEAADNLEHLAIAGSTMGNEAAAVIERMRKLRTLRISGPILPGCMPKGLHLEMYAAEPQGFAFDAISQYQVTHLTGTFQDSIPTLVNANAPFMSLVKLVLNADWMAIPEPALRAVPNLRSFEVFHPDLSLFRMLTEQVDMLPALEFLTFSSTRNLDNITTAYLRLWRHRRLKNIHIPVETSAIGSVEILPALLTAEHGRLPCVLNIRAPALLKLEMDYAVIPPGHATHQLPSLQHLKLAGGRQLANHHTFNTPQLATLQLATSDGSGFQVVAVNASYLWQSSTITPSQPMLIVDAPKLLHLQVDAAPETMCVDAPWLERLTIESQQNLVSLYLKTPSLRELKIRLVEALTNLIVMSNLLRQCRVHGTPSLSNCVVSSPMLREVRFKSAHVEGLEVESEGLDELLLEGAAQLRAVDIRCPTIRSVRLPASSKVSSVNLQLDTAHLDASTLRQFKYLKLLAAEGQRRAEIGENSEVDSIAAVLRRFGTHNPELVGGLAAILAANPRNVLMYSPS